MALSLPVPLRLFQAGVLALAAVLGLLAGLAPAYAAALAIGAAFVTLALGNLTLGLLLYVVVIFFEALPAYFGGISFAKFMGALLVISWVAAVSTRGHRDDRDVFPALAMVTLVLLGTWLVLSLLWAEDTSVAVESLQRWIPNLALFGIIFEAARRRRHLEWVFAVFVLSALGTALLGFGDVLPGSTDETDEDTEGRLGGAGINPNQLGSIMIVSIMFAVALGSDRARGGPARAAWFALAGCAGLALFATGSRGALVGMAAALLLLPFVAGRGRRPVALALVVLAVLGSAAYFVALAPEGVRERVTSPETSGSGRTDLWRIGLRMVEANPTLGVGVGNFQVASVQYLLEPGAIQRADIIVDKPKAAHNIYLQALAEIGAVGFALFCLVIGFCLWCTAAAARTFLARGDRQGEILARALMLGLVGMAAAGVFSSGLVNKHLWLVLALCPALLGIARRREGVT